MNLSVPFIRRPVATTLLTIGVLLSGAVAFTLLPVAPLPQVAGEGVGVAEGFRGDVLHWVRTDSGGLIDAVFARDPAWFHWPLIEALIEPLVEPLIERPTLPPVAPRRWPPGWTSSAASCRPARAAAGAAPGTPMRICSDVLMAARVGERRRMRWT